MKRQAKRRGDQVPRPEGEGGAVGREIPGGPERGVVLAVLAVQTVAAAYLGWLKIRSLADLPPGGRYPSPFFHIMATVDWAGAAAGLVLLAVACLMPRPPRIDPLVAWLGNHTRSVAAATTIVFALLSLCVHQAYPLTMDEYAVSFQAAVFARGRLTGQWPPEVMRLVLPPGSAFFASSAVTGQVCSEYWPGHALLMAPFAAVGIPWALNPLLAGCSLLLMAAAARRAFGQQAAGWAVLLAIASPVFAAYGISFYAMMGHCTLNLLFARLLWSPTRARVAGAGAVGGFALTLHNPFPHVAFALPWLGWLAMRRDRWTTLPLIGLCYAAVFLPIDLGWREVEHTVKADRPVALVVSTLPAAGIDNRSAAPAERSPAEVRPAAAGRPGAMARDTLDQALGHLRELTIPSVRDLLLGRFEAVVRTVSWDAPGLLALACLAAWRHRRETIVRLYAASAVSTLLLYSLVPLSGGHGWGYRYFFSAWGCLPLLAGGLVAPVARPGGTGPRDDAPGGAAARSLQTIGLAAMLGLPVVLPIRLWQMHDFIAEHRGQLPPLPEPAASRGGDVVRFLDVRSGWFRLDLVRNDPFFERGPYTFISTGADNDRIVIEDLGRAVGLYPRMTCTDARGSTWVLEPPPVEGGPR